MTIPYTYEIVSVDEVARCMEVLYTSDGRDPHRVSVRLPYEDESLDAVIYSFSPVSLWGEKESAVIVPKVGTKGVYAPSATSDYIDPNSNAANLEMWEQIECEKKVVKVLLKLGVIDSDPTIIPVEVL